MNMTAFIGRMGISRLNKLGEAITTAVVEFDPETASQVQIDSMNAHCQELASRVAKAEADEIRLHATVTDLDGQLSRTVQAAQMIGDRVRLSPNDSVLNKQLGTLMDSIEQIGGPEGDGSTAGTLFDARKDHADAESELHEWQTVHAGAVETLTAARTRLKKTQTDMERAKSAEMRQAELQEQAKRDAGLKSGMDTNNIALSAMERAATEAKQRARAAQLNTEAIRGSSGSDAASIVKATLSAPPQESALDRLARLKKTA